MPDRAGYTRVSVAPGQPAAASRVHAAPHGGPGRVTRSRATGAMPGGISVHGGIWRSWPLLLRRPALVSWEHRYLMPGRQSLLHHEFHSSVNRHPDHTSGTIDPSIAL